MTDRTTIEEVAHQITKEFTDRGKLIEAGWAAFAHLVIPKDAPPIQFQEMRLAYMAGAEHLFSSIMNILDPGDEPTEADMHRLDLIGKEIDEWRERLAERVQGKESRHV
jgi:hypothetical protein